MTRVQHREGYAKNTGAAYSMDIVSVLSDFGVSEIVWPTREGEVPPGLPNGGAVPKVGDHASLACEFRAYNNNLSISVLGPGRGVAGLQSVKSA